MKYALILFMMVANLVHAQNLRFTTRENHVDLMLDGRMLTSYCFFDSTEKPVLFPIRTVSGVTVTRGYPISPRPGERTDHPHHVGLWLNYESVNGLDFWNNSDDIPPERKHLYGSIRHTQVTRSEAKGTTASLSASAQWVDPKGVVLLDERTDFTFSVRGSDFVIDRTSTLTAAADEVIFKDVKDGMLGLRVARALEMPSQQANKFVDANGNITAVATMNNEGVTGSYQNREGVSGDDTWGKRSAWTVLNGELQGKKISIVIIDHPTNPGYPTHWHARGYGLFAANPLGQKIFSDGKMELNLKLQKGEKATFKFRIVIHEGTNALTREEIDTYMAAFTKK